MGIMPVDRDTKWRDIFRRFGLPTDTKENETTSQQENVVEITKRILDNVVPEPNSKTKAS